jgi:putative ABC transport system permease protein
MHRLAWLALYRSFTRHKLFTAVNVGGLALGVAVFLILALFVRYETTFDHALPGWDKTWLVQRTMQFAGAPEVNIPSRREMLALLKADDPQLVGTRLLSTQAAVRLGNGSVAEQLGQVDPNYFRLFPLPIVAGDPTATLRTPDGAVITESIARTYLAGGPAIGRTLSLALNGKPRLVRVGAVIRDLPTSLTQRNAIFIALAPDADLFGLNSKGLVTFLRLDTTAAVSAAGSRVAGFDRRHPDPDFKGPPDKLRMTEKLVPLASLHLDEPRERMVVAALGLVGLLALLVAIGNYVNLATARSSTRAREVAMRKVLGASRTALIGQFLGEAIATAAIAVLLGLALAEVAAAGQRCGGHRSRAALYGRGIDPPADDRSGRRGRAAGGAVSRDPVVALPARCGTRRIGRDRRWPDRTAAARDAGNPPVRRRGRAHDRHGRTARPGAAPPVRRPRLPPRWSRDGTVVRG